MRLVRRLGRLWLLLLLWRCSGAAEEVETAGGMSGGPLLNIQGEVVGVNTLVRPELRGLGNYAIESNAVGEALAAVREAALKLDDYTLTGLAMATPLFGSAVLAFAVERGALSGAEGYDLSRLDEAFTEERWGVDAEAAERAEGLRAEAVMLDRWFAALR